MKLSFKLKMERYLSIILVVAIVLSNSGVGVRAAETTESGDTHKEYTVSVYAGSQVLIGYISKIKDSSGMEAELKDEKYLLDESGDYTCVLSGKGIQEHTVKLVLDKENKTAKAFVNCECVDLEYSSELLKGNKTSPKADNLGITWLWSVENVTEEENTGKSETPRALIDVNTGEITANEVGKIKVTKKDSKDTTFEVSKEFDIIAKTGTFQINCFVNEQEWEDIGAIGLEIEDVNIDIENNTCVLEYGKEYAYSVREKGFDSSGKFVTPTEESGKKEIDINLELEAPILKVNGKDLSENEIKANESVKVSCSNYDNLYNKKSTWKYKINDKTYEVEKEFSLTTPSKDTTIEFYLELNTDTESGTIVYESDSWMINTFKDYNISYRFMDTTVAKVNSKTFVDGVGNTVGTLVGGNTYTLKKIDITGLEFADDTSYPSIAIDCFTQDYQIVLPDDKVAMTKPKINIKEKDTYSEVYGNQVKITIFNESDLYKPDLKTDETGWEWNCDSELEINQDNILTLGGVTGQEYPITYKFKDKIESNTVTVSSQKIVLKFADNIILEDKKYYDGTAVFSVELDVNRTNFQLDDFITELPSDILILEGNVELADAKNYTKFKVNDIKIKGDTDSSKIKKYDISALLTTLEKQEFEINKLEATVTMGKTIPISYHTGEYNPVSMREYIEIDSITTETTLQNKERFVKDTLINALGKPSRKDETFWEFKTLGDADGSDKVLETTNINYLLQNCSNSFEGETSKQIIAADEVDVWSLICLKQDEKTLTKGQWINSNDITAGWTALAEQTKYSINYSNICFRKLTDINEAERTSKEENSSLLTLNDIEESDKNNYYQMVFCGRGESYDTLGAVICVIGEDNTQEEMSSTIEGSDGVSYHVYNFKLDMTADEVKVTDPDASQEENTSDEVTEEANSNADAVSKKWKAYLYDKSQGVDAVNFSGKKIYKEQGDVIDITVTNKGAESDSVYYLFKKKNTDVTDADNWTEIKNVNWNDRIGTTQVKVPNQDGDYVLYVKTKNIVGLESIYVSDIIIVDNVEPEIKLDIAGETYNGITEKERLYLDKHMQGKLSVCERNIKSVSVSIKAKNAKGETIEHGFSEEEIERVLTESGYTGSENETVIDTKTNSIDFKIDGNYIILVTVKDEVGHEKTVSYHVTIDAAAPETGEVKITGFFDEIVENADKEDGIITTKRTEFEKTWNSFVERIYEIFAKDTVTVTLSAEDKMTDVEISYLMTDKEYTEEQLNDMEDSKWTAYDPDNKPQTQVNQREYVYMKVEDKAGNESYFNSKGIITDAVAPSIDAQLSKEANANNFYNGDVKISVNVSELTASTQAGASGLKYVGYRVESNGEVTEAKAVIGKSTSETEKSFDINLDAQKHNKNDIKVYITAVDNAGNRNVTEPINLKIDSVKPEISVTYNDESGSEYYNHTRTATIVIKERNLNTKDVEINIKSEHGSKASVGKWTHTDNIGKSDDAVYTCQVTFDADDDYEFSVDCVDKAGNKANEAFSDKFTVDKTIPVINVSYSNGQMEQNGYYNEAVTATITIEEHNFEAGKADVRISSEEGTVASSGFSNNGDTHTASVVFDRDGTYSLQVSFTDEAGNEAEAYQGNSFNIDLKNPEIVISNVKDKSANKDDVIPVITCTDRNYDANRVSVTIQGSNSGEIGLDKLGLETRAVANGEEFSLTFPKEEAMDDVYTLTAKVVDKAGNETEESIQFSVNRYGSVYTLGTETGEWLSSDECAYIKESKPVVIIETNVDEVVERNIAYTVGEINAETVKVKEMADCSAEEKSNGAYYESREISTGNDWYQYQYTVAAENFTKEGNYRIQIDSVDKAGNHVSNVSNNHSESKLEIAFAVDQTAPSAVVSGTENGGIYSGSSHTVLLSVEDNMVLNTVSVYLNGNEYATYDAKEILELEDGMIPVEVEESLSTQTIQLKATDMAGNVLGKDADGKYDAEFEDFELLVTSNRLAQMLHSYWIFIILAVVAAGMVIAVVILKRKRKKVSE